MDVCPSSPVRRSEDYNPNLLIRNTLVEHFHRFRNKKCADSSHSFDDLTFVD